MQTKHDVQKIGAGFQIPGQFVSAIPYGSGHINDTYAATYEEGGNQVRYILQRINHNIFKDPIALMENIARVTAFQHESLKAAGVEDTSRRALTLIPSQEGLPYHKDAEGNIWRTYLFIENARTFDAIETAAQAEEAARAFGEFQKQVTNLPGGRLNETIPDFHHTPKRLEALEKAIAEDPCGRVKEVQPEINFILARRDVTKVLIDKQAAGLIPERITHNDTKLNNVMLDDQTQRGICVIDLDTVMPGLALYDFGDMVRTATSPCQEDELDLSLISMQMPMFKALVNGYLSAAHEFLVPEERAQLAFSGKLITLEIGIRFLTDYLQGDKYFKIKRERHNLDRCRTQLRLVQSIEEQEEAMNEVVRNWTPSA
jgi:hypothetical protein